MRLFYKAITATATMLVIRSATAAPEAFTIDSNHTYPMFEATHFGISIQRGR